MSHHECNIEVGDIIFVESNTIMSRMIKAVTKFKYSHVAIVVDAEEGTVLEVTGFKKAQIIGIRELIGANNTCLKRVRKELNAADKRVIQEVVTGVVGKSYDYKAIIHIFFDYLFNLKHDHKSDFQKIYCAEIVDYIYEVCNIDLVPHKQNHTVTIEDLYLSDELETKFSITLYHEVD